MRGKRGVSPLVATILLIAFAVALGAVIMQFGEAAVVGVCGSAIQLQASGSCADASTIRFTISNKGNEEIAKIKAEAVGSSSITKEYDMKIPPRTGKEGSIQYSTSMLGELKGLKLIPIVGSTTCDENAAYLQKIQLQGC